MMSSARSILVTGGSRGLGAALVDAFLAEGDQVATCSRTSSEETQRWASDPALADRFYHQALDITARAACEQFVGEAARRFGGIDVLVNNAGLAHAGVLGLTQPEDLDRIVDLNVKATIYMTKLAVRHMLIRGSGRIINISSVVGRDGYRGLTVYGASKAALDGFTRALAREVGTRGITVNSVAPGYVRTDMTHGLDDRQLEQIVRRTPLGRLGEANDVAEAVRFLASDAARFITGHVLVVDGGLTA